MLRRCMAPSSAVAGDLTGVLRQARAGAVPAAPGDQSGTAAGYAIYSPAGRRRHTGLPTPSDHPASRR